MHLARLFASMVAPLLAVSAAALVAPTTAWAHNASGSLTVEQLTDASDYIVTGTISSMDPWEDERGRIWTHLELNVSDVHKGPPDLQVLDLDILGGEINGHGVLVFSSPRFSVGEEVFLFAETLGSGKTMPTGMALGKYTVRLDPERAEPMLVQFNPPYNKPYDHRFIPHPEPSERLYMDVMIQLVDARVAEGWDGQPIPGKSAERLEAMHGVRPASAVEVQP